MLAKKELLRLAAAVRSHICCGKPNDEHNKQTQTFAMDTMSMPLSNVALVCVGKVSTTCT